MRKAEDKKRTTEEGLEGEEDGGDGVGGGPLVLEDVEADLAGGEGDVGVEAGGGEGDRGRGVGVVGREIEGDLEGAVGVDCLRRSAQRACPLTDVFFRVREG